jgi:hypothetical protein
VYGGTSAAEKKKRKKLSDQLRLMVERDILLAYISSLYFHKVVIFIKQTAATTLQIAQVREEKKMCLSIKLLAGAACHYANN